MGESVSSKIRRSEIERESEAEREEFFTVKEILCPEKVRLSNGFTVKLIGIKSEPFKHDKAVGYLTEKNKGKTYLSEV